MTEVTSLVLYNLDMFLLELLGETVLKSSNTLCFLSYVGYLRAQMCCNLPCKFIFQDNVYLQYFTAYIVL